MLMIFQSVSVTVIRLVLNRERSPVLAGTCTLVRLAGRPHIIALFRINFAEKPGFTESA